ncbi:tRNA-intron endonuclease [Phytophthora palmivora]|uniref:tRNA-intron lyase n=1 Tax=Phytophthora palmivora TaxID=4796 RepID=A0A2P4XBI2_9STRA|nr:tRNA-intron endonuclease [Phytophthora palmivora]
MVTWKIRGTGVEVTFEKEDDELWRHFQTNGFGIAALDTLQVVEMSRSDVGGIDTFERRRYLSLPETYYVAAIDGVLPMDEPLRELWETFKRSSEEFARHFIVYQHFRCLGWIPKSGLNYGGHYALYRGSAAEFHSEYVVYVQDSENASSWNTIQSLTRIAADVKKTVLLCTVTAATMTTAKTNSLVAGTTSLTFGMYCFHDVPYTVEAIAIRFWDALVADDPKSYHFHPQPLLPKRVKAVKKKNRIKRQKHQLEGGVLVDSGNYS